MHQVTFWYMWECLEYTGSSMKGPFFTMAKLLIFYKATDFDWCFQKRKGSIKVTHDAIILLEETTKQNTTKHRIFGMCYLHYYTMWTVIIQGEWLKVPTELVSLTCFLQKAFEKIKWMCMGLLRKAVPNHTFWHDWKHENL